MTNGKRRRIVFEYAGKEGDLLSEEFAQSVFGEGRVSRFPDDPFKDIVPWVERGWKYHLDRLKQDIEGNAPLKYYHQFVAVKKSAV